MRPIALILLLATAALAQPQPDDPAQLSQQAAVLVAHGKYAAAEPLPTHALELQEQATGPDDLSLAAPIGALAALYRAQGRNPDAQKWYARSLAIHQKATGDSLDLVPDLKLLASVYAAMGKHTEAE